MKALKSEALKPSPKHQPDHKKFSKLEAKDSDHKDSPKSELKGSAKPEPNRSPPQSAQHGTVAASKSKEAPPSPTNFKKHHQASLEVCVLNTFYLDSCLSKNRIFVFLHFNTT
jgi:hypothetical protein